jgi:hypothetical protein
VLGPSKESPLSTAQSTHTARRLIGPWRKSAPAGQVGAFR